jgi:ABC-type glycerol-3-phosphate transport system permease component
VRAAVRVLQRAALYTAAGVFTVFAVFPFYWMLLTAFNFIAGLTAGAVKG